MTQQALPVGKLPAALLEELLSSIVISDEHVLVGPGPGMDCAVIDLGPSLLVLKSDPVTFLANDLGWYLVQINANDIATTGAVPRWLMATLLFPEETTTERLVDTTFKQLNNACGAMGISLIGGHTEITHGLDRPIALGTLIGLVDRDSLVTPRGAMPGDRLLLTKFVPIEAIAILAIEFPHRLEGVLSGTEIREAQSYLRDPGISVLSDAQIALASGQINAMHDPTEGGLAAALWELADACGHTIVVDVESVPVSPLARRVCSAFGIDYMAAIGSGALLLSVPNQEYEAIGTRLRQHGILCTTIGHVRSGRPEVWQSSPSGWSLMPRPARDAIARIYDEP